MSDQAVPVRRIRSQALKWYDRNGRRLPWRNCGDPYRVWISEIMLQQTTVTAVIPFFERFVQELPTVSALACASEAQVMKLWEGLGYYSRARNLRRAAQQIVEQHSGEVPAELEALQSLPGIGRYTAGAIRSFAFDLPAPIVEANTERLFARLLGFDGDVRSTKGRNALWGLAESLTSKARSGDLNQALMDLGSQVCRPIDPQCDVCPLRSACTAFRDGREHEVPMRVARAAVTDVYEIVCVLRSRGRVFVKLQADDVRWAGLWDFVRREVPESNWSTLADRLSAAPITKAKRRGGISQGSRGLLDSTALKVPREIVELVASETAGQPESIVQSCRLDYSITRYRVHVLCLLCEVSSGPRSTSTARWATASELEQLALPKNSRLIERWLRKSRST